MTATTPTEISWSPVVSNCNYGTYKRRIMVFYRATSVVSNTMNIATYVPGVTDIEGIVYATDDGADASTYPTWSTTTVTETMAGAGEYCFMCTFT